jgi:hypothetical protein
MPRYYQLTLGKSFDQTGQHIIREMVHEVRHREQPLPAGRTAGHNDSGSVVRHARLLCQECVEVMASDFVLKRPAVVLPSSSPILT